MITIIKGGNMINIKDVNFKVLAEQLNCELNPKKVVYENMIKGYYKMNVLTNKGITLGYIAFKDGFLHKVKQYKKEDYCTIDENEFIFFRLQRFFEDGQMIPYDEFRRLIEMAHKIREEDLAQKQRYRDNNPKKGRKKLQGKNVRWILWNLVLEWSPFDTFEHCIYCGKYHDLLIPCPKQKKYEDNVKQVNEMVRPHEIVVNIQGSDKFLMSEEGKEVVIKTVRTTVDKSKLCPFKEEKKEEIKIVDGRKTPLLCRMFGHKPPVYKENVGGKYARVLETTKDGIGRRHADIWGECARCGKAFMICRIHIPADPKIELCEKTIESALKISDLWVPPKPTENRYCEYGETEHEGEYQALNMMYVGFKNLLWRLRHG